MECALILKRWIASNTVYNKTSAQGCAYPGFPRKHLIWIAIIIKNEISLIISLSECSINHKGPLNHIADRDADVEELCKEAYVLIRFERGSP